MFLIWGTRGYEERHGDTIIKDQCPNCHNEVVLEAREQGRKVTFFFLPLFKVSVKHYIVCPICHYGKEIGKGMLSHYIEGEEA